VLRVGSARNLLDPLTTNTEPADGTFWTDPSGPVSTRFQVRDVDG